MFLQIDMREIDVIPPFKKVDRYKISSYRAFNFKYPHRYDTSIWMHICQTSRWDRAVVTELRPGIDSLRILDVGCATGRVLRSLAGAGAKHLAGVDLAPRMIDVAREKLRERRFEAELKSADAEEEIPWPDGSFDVVTLTGVLHHLFRPEDALDEIYRVLRHNGRILILDPWYPPPLRGIVNLYLRMFSHDGDCRFYSPAAVARMLEPVGWSEVQYRKVGWYSFMVSGLKRSADSAEGSGC